MSFRRIVVTVDDDPIAAHAADVGMELARSVGAELALIHAIDPPMNFSPEAGLSAAELVLRSRQESTSTRNHS